MIPIAAHTKPLFHSLLPELGPRDHSAYVHLPTNIDLSNQMDNATLPSTTNSTSIYPSWVVARLLDNVENIKARIFDDVDSDQHD
jgi:hypothetical protein